MAEGAFVSVAQAAELLGITRQAVLERIRTGGLPATNVGRTYIVPRNALSERDPVVTEIVRRLVAEYDPERVYLFGSAARENASPSSDFDVLVVVADDASPDRLRSRRAYEALWGLGAATDVVVMRRSAFEARAGVPTSLPATVLREGVLLHAA